MHMATLGHLKHEDFRVGPKGILAVAILLNLGGLNDMGNIVVGQAHIISMCVNDILAAQIECKSDMGHVGQLSKVQ